VTPDRLMVARREQLAGSDVLAVLQEASGAPSWDPAMQDRLASAIETDLKDDRQTAALTGYEALGHWSLACRQFDAAEQAYRSALQTAEQLDDPASIGDQYRHLAQLARQRGDLQAAEASYTVALRREQQTGREEVLAELTRALGDVLAAQARDAEAAEMYRQAVQWFERTGSPRDRILAAIALGTVTHSAGDHAAAEQDVPPNAAVGRSGGR
jgi:tetratricopeptide (TPR) repeat protein